MMFDILINIGLGFIIGLALGLLGGGGSILTVPALVYVIGLTPQSAVTASLMIVGTNSAVGALFHRKAGTLNWRIAGLFGGTGMVTAYVAAGLSRYFSAEVLMTSFALLMLVVGILMIVRRAPDDSSGHETAGWPRIMAAGAVVGVLTGFLGVGGGFLIVPALVMLVGLPMAHAVGTSLVIIAMNSVAGIAGHLGHLSIPLGIIAAFALAGIAGSFVGARMAGSLKPDVLRRGFAIFVIVLALFLLGDQIL